MGVAVTWCQGSVWDIASSEAAEEEQGECFSIIRND